MGVTRTPFKPQWASNCAQRYSTFLLWVGSSKETIPCINLLSRYRYSRRQCGLYSFPIRRCAVPYFFELLKLAWSLGRPEKQMVCEVPQFASL